MNLNNQKMGRIKRYQYVPKNERLAMDSTGHIAALVVAVVLTAGIVALNLHFILKGQTSCHQNHGDMYCWFFSRGYSLRAMLGLQ